MASISIAELTRNTYQGLVKWKSYPSEDPYHATYRTQNGIVFKIAFFEEKGKYTINGKHMRNLHGDMLARAISSSEVDVVTTKHGKEVVVTLGKKASEVNKKQNKRKENKHKAKKQTQQSKEPIAASKRPQFATEEERLEKIKEIQEAYFKAHHISKSDSMSNNHLGKITGEVHGSGAVKTIENKDFLVRGNAFKCMHKNHKIQNITAKMEVIPRKGPYKGIEEKTVAAGWCEQCRQFFILNSEYESLVKNYILLCRVTDEKSYSAGLYSWNGVKLAPESILMQYGYSVSATVDLSDKERHMILAALVDKGIVSKTGILSYLDFFISQRSKQTRYESAIAKWNNDKQFVMNYKNGAFMECDVDNLKL